MRKQLLMALVILSTFSGGLHSCRYLNPNLIGKVGNDYEYTELTDTLPVDYPLVPGDRFDLQIFSNNGYLLVDRNITGNNGAVGQQNIAQQTLLYDVSADGSSYLPMVGEQQIGGLTEKEAELYLAEKYDVFFKDAYVQLRVLNRRVTVYRGNDVARVIEMPNLNMTVMEAIGAAGGIPPTGKAYKVRVIRNLGRVDQSISLIDLRTPEGLFQAGKLVHPNDVIYLEPTINTAFFQQIAPIIGTITSIFVLYTYFDTISQ